MSRHAVQKPSRRLLDLREVAEELNCSVDTVDRMLRRGDLAFHRLPGGGQRGRRRIARVDLDAALARWRVDET